MAQSENTFLFFLGIAGFYAIFLIARWLLRKIASFVSGIAGVVFEIAVALFGRRQEETARPRDDNGALSLPAKVTHHHEGLYRRQRNYSYLSSRRSNHDDQKRRYICQEDAEEVIRRMRRQGKDPNGTLRSYYNPDYGSWFVGNGTY